MSGERQVSSTRLVGTLAIAGAFAGFALVFVYGATQPRIRKNKAEALRRAIHEVLKDPARYDTLYVSGDTLTKDPGGGERVYLGYDAADEPVGFAIVHGRPGFQDVVKVIFGYDAVRRKVLAMRVLESKETPGLGDKIEKDEAFVKQFEGPSVPLRGVKAGKAAGDDEVDMITGATISSRTVIRIINEAIEKWQPLLDMYLREGAG